MQKRDERHLKMSGYSCIFIVSYILCTVYKGITSKNMYFLELFVPSHYVAHTTHYIRLIII